MVDEPTRKLRWARLWRAPKSKLLLGIPVGALVFLLVGMGLWAGTGAAIKATSSDQFCAYACHGIENFVTPGYKASVHYTNASGVKAGCSDCHVPGPVGPKLLRKVAAVREGYHEIMGTIGTQEKYDARRLVLANRVWTYMKATDSRECRACHDAQRFDLEQQSRVARRVHERAQATGQTCIDCHKGVAHHPLPAGTGE